MLRSLCAVGTFGILAAAVSSASAAVVFSGDTTGDPFWNRPVAGNPPTPPTSGVGTAVPYETFSFTVDISGAYVFQSTAVSPANWDNYAFLYSPSFNAAAQFNNVLVGNDDNTTIGRAGFTRALTAGTSYVFVETGFANTNSGTWDLDVTGPGNVIVPEPASFGIIGIAAMTLLRRRSQA